MTNRKIKPERNIEKAYATKEFVNKLRRLSDSIEQKKKSGYKLLVKEFQFLLTPYLI